MNEIQELELPASRIPASRPAHAALPVMLERALDMLDAALVIVDDEGRVEYRNRSAAALLSGSHGGLELAGGVLSSASRELREGLAQAIRLACGELRPSGLCLQRGAVPASWLRLVVAPVYFGVGSRAASRAAIWILNTEAPGLPGEELLAALFGLSRAESRLAAGMLLGRTPAEYARLAGVGVATVRTQLHSIFRKTGVRRQAQLVALLAKVPVLHITERA